MACVQAWVDVFDTLCLYRRKRVLSVNKRLTVAEINVGCCCRVGAIGLESSVPADEDQLRPETRSILMAAAAFIVNDCHATRCDFCLHQRAQFSLG
jgi:hypothetical protein